MTVKDAKTAEDNTPIDSLSGQVISIKTNPTRTGVTFTNIGLQADDWTVFLSGRNVGDCSGAILENA